HHAMEDIGVMRTLPNLTVVCPGDPVEAELAVREAGAHEGPMYLRLGRAGDPEGHQQPPDLRIGSAIVLKKGRACVLIATGGILSVARQAAGRLQDSGIDAAVISMHTVKPLDERVLAEYCSRNVPVFTIEEHGRAAGLGSAVGEWLAQTERTCH